MEKLLNNFSIHDNFWECNPNISLIKEFKEVHEKDRQKGKRQGQGMLMWAIALLVDKHPDNPYRNLSEEDRRILIKEDYLKDPSFSWSEVEGLVQVYKTFCLSPTERALIQIEQKLDERNKLISSAKYTIENAEDIDKLILKTKQLNDFYKDMKAELEQEQVNEGITKGGRVESASEKGLI